jgi:hypothetical protein
MPRRPMYKNKRKKGKQLKAIVLSPNVNDYDTGEYVTSDNIKTIPEPPGLQKKILQEFQ